MCRIAGIINTTTTRDNFNFVDQMCDSMQHGGPDGKGIWQSEDKKVTLGNRRLALIDLSVEAMQPMHYGTALTITFNGEIYNHLHLKKELQSLGHVFKTESDTEVILAAYAQWHISAFKKLKGMFAFALSDGNTGKLYLVRGPIGIKPLYYSFMDNRLIFASEVKAFAHSGINYIEKDDWKIYFLAFGHIPEPFTTLEGVTSLPKGNYLEVDLHTGQHTAVQYYTFNYKEHILKKEAAEKMIYKSLRNSVREHLLSDAPIGIFLSGGIDSSILALLADESTKYLTTLSINFKEASFSEKKYQHIIADKTLSSHLSYTLEFDEFEANFDQAINAMDQPSNDGINTWFISKYAKEQGIKAVLSGIGADELFGGYTSFERTGIVTALKVMPSFLLRLIARLPFNKARRCYFLSYKNLVGEYLFLRGFYTPEIIADLLNVPKAKVNQLLSGLRLGVPHTVFSSEKARISWLETNLYLQNQLLKDTDCMSMYHGIEVRTPFLDVDFIQTCLNFKSKLRFDNRQKKRLLLDAFEGILPKTIWSRPKMGFTFPFSTWLKRVNKVNNSALYKDNITAGRLFKKFRSGQLQWAKMLVLYQVFNGR